MNRTSSSTPFKTNLLVTFWKDFHKKLIPLAISQFWGEVKVRQGLVDASHTDFLFVAKSFTWFGEMGYDSTWKKAKRENAWSQIVNFNDHRDSSGLENCGNSQPKSFFWHTISAGVFSQKTRVWFSTSAFPVWKDFLFTRNPRKMKMSLMHQIYQGGRVSNASFFWRHLISEIFPTPNYWIQTEMWAPWKFPASVVLCRLKLKQENT